MRFSGIKILWWINIELCSDDNPWDDMNPQGRGAGSVWGLGCKNFSSSLIILTLRPLLVPFSIPSSPIFRGGFTLAKGQLPTNVYGVTNFQFLVSRWAVLSYVSSRLAVFPIFFCSRTVPVSPFCGGPRHNSENFIRTINSTGEF